MVIHYAPDGGSRVVVERPDRSRIVAATRGLQYVQHPYTFEGRTFDHRTYAVQGHLLHQLYRPYDYGGTTLDVYATNRFYEPKLYQWATTRFKAPQPYKWLYKADPPPWFVYYGDYFTPSETYDEPLSWLTDFMLASTLAMAYSIEPSGSESGAPSVSTAVSPQVKQLLSEEIGRHVRRESAEAQAHRAQHEPRPGEGGIVQELGDGQPHVLLAASALDLVDLTGRRCMISAGDVVQVGPGPAPTGGAARAVVLASKGSNACGRSAQVDIALSDLQEMQNHMRETMDQGLANTQMGKNATSRTPAFVLAVPPPDADAAQEIDQQKQIAAEITG
jgi:hypothetical protein